MQALKLQRPRGSKNADLEGHNPAPVALGCGGIFPAMLILVANNTALFTHFGHL